MGRGRKPVPTAIKKARGTARADRVNDNEVQLEPVESIPNPPDILDDKAKELWFVFCTQANSLGLLHKIAYPQIVDYCMQWQIYCYNAEIVKASKAVDEYIDSQGNKRKALSAHYKAMSEARKQMVTFESNWGLNPASKTKVVANPDNSSKKKSRFNL